MMESTRSRLRSTFTGMDGNATRQGNGRIIDNAKKLMEWMLCVFSVIGI